MSGRLRSGHEWQTLISTRAGGSQCPYCSGIKLLKGFNDFKTRFPEIAFEWSDRNFSLLPEDINEKSRQNVWWKCRTCGYEWQSVVYTRVNGGSCPVCAARKVLPGINDLTTTDPGITGEWDYDKNKYGPDRYSRHSMEHIWWKGSCRHYITFPKTNAGARDIPMLSDVRETFQAMYERREDFNYLDQVVVDGYTNIIFRDLSGNLISAQRVNDYLRRVTRDYNEEEEKKAKAEHRQADYLPDFTCHNLRHTFCSLMVLEGMNIKTLQKIMGHAHAETKLFLKTLNTDASLMVLGVFGNCYF